MAQIKFSQLDGIKFDPENHAGVEIYINTLDGTLVFKDQEVSATPLSKLVGFENIDSVFLVERLVMVRDTRTFKMLSMMFP